MTSKPGPAYREGETQAERHARWVRSIERAHFLFDSDLSIDKDRRAEIEDHVLREIGIRAPLVIDGIELDKSAKLDAAYRKGGREVAKLLRYYTLLFEEPGFREKFKRIQDGESNVNVKHETWSAAFKLFREIGGGCSPEHIRLTMHKFKEELESMGPPGRPLIPFPTGDPPPVENGD